MKLAVVVPRYGPEIGGGAEGLARWAALWLARRHDVTVLTTSALDYRTWADHYPPGETRDGGVRVLRFPVPIPRDGERFDRFYSGIVGRRPGVLVEQEWMRLQGPVVPGLIENLEADGGRYDAVLFVPYLYATTYFGLPVVADRSVLIPALHDEPPAMFRLMERTFSLARGIAFSTAEERQFCAQRFGAVRALNRLVGTALAPVPPGATEPADGRRRYVLYLGRVDQSKGCDTLLAHHAAAVRHSRRTPRLVLAGRIAMDLPRAPWLDVRGYVDEEEKARLLAGAIALVMPSSYESLSIVLLEAWQHGRPVLVTEASDVLVGQVRRAGGGLWYADADEYRRALDWLAAHPYSARALGTQGRRYARGRFRPEAVGARLEGLLGEVVTAP